MRIVKCDKCGVELDGRENCMVHRETPDGHPIDFCDACLKEYDKIWNEANREFNKIIQNWFDTWR